MFCQWLGVLLGLKKVRVTAHAAYLVPQIPAGPRSIDAPIVHPDDRCRLHINVANLSKRYVQVVAVWIEKSHVTKNWIPVLNDERPLPIFIPPAGSWETWLVFNDLSREMVEYIAEDARVQLSDGTVVKARLNLRPPPAGNVPGFDLYQRK
jgi:hypothetical protein